MLHQPVILQAILGGMGPVELVIILVIVLLIFGPMKLPQIGEAIGKSVRSFRKAVGGDEDDKPVDVTPKQIESDKAKPKTVDVAHEPAKDKEKSDA